MHTKSYDWSKVNTIIGGFLRDYDDRLAALEQGKEGLGEAS